MGVARYEEVVTARAPAPKLEHDAFVTLNSFSRATVAFLRTQLSGGGSGGGGVGAGAGAGAGGGGGGGGSPGRRVYSGGAARPPAAPALRAATAPTALLPTPAGPAPASARHASAPSAVVTHHEATAAATALAASAASFDVEEVTAALEGARLGAAGATRAALERNLSDSLRRLEEHNRAIRLASMRLAVNVAVLQRRWRQKAKLRAAARAGGATDGVAAGGGSADGEETHPFSETDDV